MSYALLLTVNVECSSLALLKDEAVLCERTWPEKRDMGRQLLEALKQILEETGIRPEEAREFTVAGEAPENSTSRRIAETVAAMYTFSVAYDSPREGSFIARTAE